MRTSWRTTRRSASPTGRPKSRAIKKFGSAGKKTAVISTINGDANVPFYKELGNQGVKASDIPVIAFSVGEEELAGIDTKPLVGHLTAWSYFESVNTPENKAFIAKWHAYNHDPKRVTNDPMESAYILFHMWVQAVQQAGTTDVNAVRQAMIGQKVKSPSGFEVDDVSQPPHGEASDDRRRSRPMGSLPSSTRARRCRRKPGAPTSKRTRARSPTGPGRGRAAVALLRVIRRSRSIGTRVLAMAGGGKSSPSPGCLFHRAPGVAKWQIFSLWIFQVLPQGNPVMAP